MPIRGPVGSGAHDNFRRNFQFRECRMFLIETGIDDANIHACRTRGQAIILPVDNSAAIAALRAAADGWPYGHLNFYWAIVQHVAIRIVEKIEGEPLLQFGLEL